MLRILVHHVTELRHVRHSRESGNPVNALWRAECVLDSRFRGNDADHECIHGLS